LSHAPSLEADYFDGRSARARRVRLELRGAALLVRGDGIVLDVPLAQVRWPERQRHGARMVQLRDGGMLQAADAAEWDAWARAVGLVEPLVVRAQQAWRASLVALALLIALAAIGYRWGLPWFSRMALAAVPASADRAVGEALLGSLDAHWLAPSGLPTARQEQLRAAFSRAVARAYPPGERPAYELRFGASPRLGANALALPGGTIVVTDRMLQLLDGRDDVACGVLAHELGHVRHRHGMRLLLQTAVLGAATGLVLGDFGSVLAAAPVLLGQAGYSRDAERQADAEAVAVLRANDLSPAIMVELFRRLAEQRHAQAGDAGALGIALASHPTDAERIEAFRAAAR
jgi:Zn-dependent protease with chaperone function